jgi:hypothetical protein
MTIRTTRRYDSSEYSRRGLREKETQSALEFYSKDFNLAHGGIA